MPQRSVMLSLQLFLEVIERLAKHPELRPRDSFGETTKERPTPKLNQTLPELVKIGQVDVVSK
jgi:hypothetical protein